ncbi:MAG: hypothetical protein EOO59_01860 [Hymenobacter sp.]|nr:MAG: hypothetical protein EOO59_01860 [Hymenobacter sp.]
MAPSGRPRPGVGMFLTTSLRRPAATDAYGTFQLPVAAAAARHRQAEYAGLGRIRFDTNGQYPQAGRMVLGC